MLAGGGLEGGGGGGETGTSAATYGIIGLHYNMWMDGLKVFFHLQSRTIVDS